MTRQDKDVVRRLLIRKKKKRDNHKIGLIIEGGGMRGAFSGGAMAALEELGLTDAFDVVYASSSGSCAGAYFLSGQTKLGTSIYYEDLDGYKFIKPWKISRAANIDYLCDVIFRYKKKLDTSKIRQSKTIFKIFVADADHGNCTYYTNKDKADIIQVIKASCALPAYYNKPVTIGPNVHMDGRIGKAIPIEDAITDGCTDVLIITTVPEDFEEKNEGLLEGRLKKFLMRNLSSQYKEKYHKDRKSNYNESLDVIFGRAKVHRKINIYTIPPDYLVSKFESRREKLIEAIEHGKSKTKEAFSLVKAN